MESKPLNPAPPVGVIDPSDTVPSSATLRATIELFAELVMKYTTFAFLNAAPFLWPFPVFKLILLFSSPGSDFPP